MTAAVRSTLMHAPHVTWGTKTWMLLLVSVCLIAPLSLFVHDFMLETLKVPYPTTVGLPATVKFLNQLVRVYSFAQMCRLARPQLQGLSRGWMACAAGLCLMMLNETLRVVAIETAIVGSGLYSILDVAPKGLLAFAGGFAGAWIGLSIQKRQNLALAAILAAALIAFALHPALDALCESLKNGLPEPTVLYTDPYPFKINILIYVTFIEPTIASFIIASFCWSFLAGNPLRRILTFTALLLLIRGRFVSLLVESFWVDQPLPTAFLAVGQFFLETLTLGLLTALMWSYVVRRSQPW